MTPWGVAACICFLQLAAAASVDYEASLYQQKVPDHQQPTIPDHQEPATPNNKLGGVEALKDQKSLLQKYKDSHHMHGMTKMICIYFVQAYMYKVTQFNIY